MSPQKGIPATSVPNEPGMSQTGPEAARPGLGAIKDYLRSSAASCAAVEYASSNASFAWLKRSFAWLRNRRGGIAQYESPHAVVQQRGHVYCIPRRTSWQNLSSTTQPIG